MANRGLSARGHPADDLTWREQEILSLLAERLTNREIADQLHLAESTVKDYVGKILSKLHVKNRRQAVERGLALGLLGTAKETSRTSRNNLPVAPTAFVGRLGELGEIQRQLKTTRLLTLTGPGGIGKTRLAIEAARSAAGGFQDGCFMVPLARISTADRIPQTIAEALNFPLATQEEPKANLLRYLRKRQVLLVMDNFEHILDGAGLVSEILQIAPQAKILATSRERLNLQSETVLPVTGMGTPDSVEQGEIDQFDSVALFIQRASQVLPGFDPANPELKNITRLCQAVQGMPLAIELAAAWLAILNLDEIIAELNIGLEILTTDLRDIPERHRSIRVVFDHSWQLLDPREQDVLLRLSIFRGGFTFQAAQQVTGATSSLLKGFVQKSILTRDPSNGRLVIHELLRQFVHSKLSLVPDTLEETRASHAAYYGSFMAERWDYLRDHRQMAAFAEIEADIENIRDGWQHALEKLNISQLWQFVFSLWYLHWIRWWNHAGQELFAQAARKLRAEVNPNLQVLIALIETLQAYFLAWQGQADLGYDLAKSGVQVLENAEEPLALVIAYDCLIINSYMTNRFDEEEKISQRMLAVGEGMNDPWAKAFILFAASMSALVHGDFSKAETYALKNLEISTEIGDILSTTMPLIVLGHVAFAEGNYEIAQDYYSRCLEIAEETGFPYGIQTASKYLTKVTISLGQFSEAGHYLVQSLKISEDIGFIRDVINLFVEYARLLKSQDEHEAAVEMLGLVVHHPASLETRMFEGVIRDTAQDLLSTLETELPKDRYHQALTKGKTLNLEKAMAAIIQSNANQHL